jgi:hypothetical protein
MTCICRTVSVCWCLASNLLGVLTKPLIRTTSSLDVLFVIYFYLFLFMYLFFHYLFIHFLLFFFFFNFFSDYCIPHSIFLTSRNRTVVKRYRHQAKHQATHKHQGEEDMKNMPRFFHRELRKKRMAWQEQEQQREQQASEATRE